MPQLDVSTFPSQIFWLLVCFGILCLIVTAFLAPRLAKPLQQRLAIIEDYQSQTNILLEQAEQLALASKEAINAAKHQAAHKLHHALNEAQNLRTSRLQSFDHEIQKQLHDLQLAVQQQQEEILNNSRDLVVQIVHSLYTKLTNQAVNEQHIDTYLTKK